MGSRRSPSPKSNAPSVSPPSNSSASSPTPPPSNSSAAPPPNPPPPSNSSAAPPPSKSSAPPPNPPPLNSPAAPPPSNSSAAPPPAPSAPPPSNTSAAPPPAPPPSNSSPVPSAPPLSPPPPPASPPPPSNNSSTPSPATPHPPPPPPALSQSPPPPRPAAAHSPPPPPKHVPSPSPPPPPPPAAATQNSTPIANLFNSLDLSTNNVIVIGAFAGLLALSLLVLAVCILCRRKKKKNHKHHQQQNSSKDFSKPDHYDYIAPSPFASTQNSVASSTMLRAQYSNASSDVGMGSSRSWFTYEELSEATDGFSVNNLIGQGGFGCVYKGVLTADGNGRQVAVKQLKAGSGQGEREFRAEVEIISRIHHKHLVSLVGYCICENQRLLVYDFVPNNNLDYHLHDDGKPVMDWASRVKVVSGAARGLAYLHEDCQPRIIHRDIKTTNILLDNNFEAKVADFGLAKMAMELDLHTHVSTRVMGTFGYMAPEYAASGKLTEKSDVFSFGVVLLELITGRMPVDPSQPLGDESLVECARPLLAEALKTQDFDGLVDPRLENNFIEAEMFRMIEAAAACVRHSAAKRPKMSQIARALDSMEELADLNNGMRPGQSGNLDSREHSARIRMFDRMAFGGDDNSSEFNSRSQRSQRSWRS